MIRKGKICLASSLALAMEMGSMTHGLEAAETGTAGPASEGLETITVTARRKEESLQDVPDSIRAYSAEILEAAGVRDVSGFVALTPNITLRESFRQGQTYITVRGITTGQQGWAPVTYVVDGVPVGSTDSINTGALVGIERIEVLKGPQGALYGAGAIAGAINIVTKAPGDELSGEVVAGYGRHDDQRYIGSVSVPLAEATGLRLDGYYHESDGLQSDQSGRGVNGDETVDARARLVTELGPVDLDLRAHVVDVDAGAVFQELLPHTAAGLAMIDDFDASPGIVRGILGTENRKLEEASAKIDLDVGFATLTSITAYSDLRQRLFGSTSWNAPPATSFCGPVGGAGQPPDCTQASRDDFRVFSQDLRLASNGSGSLQWLVGASMLNRRALNALTVGDGAPAANGSIVTGPTPFLRRADLNEDRFAGAYAQVIFNVTDALELTGALRYDRNKMSSTQYADDSLATVVPVVSPTGEPIETQHSRDDAWQPKLQASYRWSPTFMTYATAGKGFRTGFYNTGNRTQAETTWNYEVGFKSELLDNRAVLNLSVFHIDYSNQQFTTIIPAPPYRATSNIAETKINGLEVDTSLQVSDSISTGLSVGVTDSEVQDADKTHGPFTPAFMSNLYLQLDRPLSADWTLAGRLDWRYQSSQYLGRDDQFKIDPKNYVDARASLGYVAWTFTAYVRNLTGERQAFGFEDIGFGYLRYDNNSRTYGAEMSYKF
jgi:iron complex outermembrane recepter protein